MSVSVQSASTSSAGGADLIPQSSNEEPAFEEDYPSSQSSPPPTFQDIERWQYHISLREFGEDLQAAAKAIFPNDSNSKYTKVNVLILSWQDEDPQLPVSLEIRRLYEVFKISTTSKPKRG